MIKILGTGMYIPKNLITNESFFEKFGRDPLEKVFDRIGHGARYYCDENESSADIAVQAAKEALKNADVNAEDIDLIIVATDTPSQLSPATVSEVQYRLQAVNAGTFDVNCACAAFVTACDIASKYLSTDSQYKTALIIGTYAMSKFLDPEDSIATPLFGDGSGAFVIQEGNKDKKIASSLKADGQYWDYMGIYAGGTKEPINPESLDKKKNTTKILKKFPATLNSEEWPPLIEKTLKKIDLRTSDVNAYIFTQIRKATIETVMERFELPMDQTHTIMEKWGYTGSACIPMAFHDAIVKGKIKRGDRVVLCASGGGYAMACITFVY